MRHQQCCEAQDLSLAVEMTDELVEFDRRLGRNDRRVGRNCRFMSSAPPLCHIERPYVISNVERNLSVGLNSSPHSRVRMNLLLGTLAGLRRSRYLPGGRNDRRVRRNDRRVIPDIGASIETRGRSSTTTFVAGCGHQRGGAGSDPPGQGPCASRCAIVLRSLAQMLLLVSAAVR